MPDTRVSLIERVRNHEDSVAWAEFFAIYRPLLVAYVRKRGVSEHDAADVVQEVFSRLVPALAQFEFDRERGRFRTWLWRVTHNALADWGRRRAVRDRVEKEWAEQAWIDEHQRTDDGQSDVTSISRYMIVGDLGSGGQADVYRVIDPKLGRDLVLKLSHRRSVDGEGRRDALLAEGRLLALLDHPGLVRIVEIGIHDDRTFLVLDYVPGRNLEQIFADKRPSVREAARLIAEVARAVAYAHRRGVVHGDITPRNILIDGHGGARLIDFGLSKIEDAWSESAGPRGGTPEFLPPEVLAGGDQPSSSRPTGDVFGLGATLYWLLTGQAPFAAPSAWEAIERSRRCDIDFDALPRAGVPARIARPCRQSLAANPNDRPAADVLADALERASRPWITRRAAAAIVATALAGIGLFGLWAEFHEGAAPPPVSIVHSIPKITVGIRNLSNVVPLNTGDRIAISCNMSPGETAVMLWFNAAGEVKQYSPVRDVAANVDRMVYPAPHEDMPLTPPEGTDMIFFCRGKPISEDELNACFPVGKPPPPLPEQNYLELQRGVVDIKGPHEESASPSEIPHVSTMMKDINRSLMKHFQSVTGIAFPHRPAD